MKDNILVMGASGQIGTELLSSLQNIYGSNRVIASDVKVPHKDILQGGIFEYHDCTDGKKTQHIVDKYNIKTIYNLPSILSATSEEVPQKAFEVNLVGLFNTLEVARQSHCAVFTPSTIGVFGASTPKINTPQETIMRPETMYGITKISGELLCDYYYKKYNLDTRGVRYPGIISYKTLPGGGTTDFAVDIYHQAITQKSYTSYIKKGTFLDMMYMPDAVEAAIQIMNADTTNWKYRNAYNITSMSLDPDLLKSEIQKHIPDFSLNYDIDSLRQNIANSWPDSLDDSDAKRSWGWCPKYNLESMTTDILKNLSK